jgi:hypothetical protein
MAAQSENTIHNSSLLVRIEEYFKEFIEEYMLRGINQIFG